MYLLGSFKMKSNLQVTISKRVLITILVALLAFSIFNTFLIFERTSGPADTSAVSYDYVLSKSGDNYILKDMATGIPIVEAHASTALIIALDHGKTVYLNPGTYVLTDDIKVINKLNSKIISDGATIQGNGHKITVVGDNYTTSKFATISGLTIINATIHIENSFSTTISNVVFENTSCAIEFVNTQTWSEYNQIDNCQFINATEGIVFHSPVGNATGSYASSEINHCSFNIRDNSVGINVEKSAQLSDSQIQDVRFWLGGDGSTNQTGLLNNGSMDQTLLQGVVFESFTDNPHNMYAINLGEFCNPAAVLDGAVSFLGTWTARIYNPFSHWINGEGSAFNKNNINVPVGSNSQYGKTVNIGMQPLEMFTFKPKIGVSNLGSNEVVTVRVRFEFVDNVVGNSVEKNFSSNQEVWLSDDDMMTLYPSQSVIYAVLVDAQSNQASSNAVVLVSGYGTAG